jgi:ABC-type uncharacterized transport system substrate-binding protein
LAVGTLKQDKESLQMKSWTAGFIVALGVALVCANTQAADKVFRLGLCHVGLDHTPPHLPTMRKTLASLGYVEGKNLRFEFRNLADEAAARTAMQEFLREHVDLIVAFEDNCARAARALIKDVPVVIAGTTDPVGLGLVKSLARPGGNITGFANWGVVQAGKQIEIFKQVDPGLRKLAVLYDPADPVMRDLQPEIQTAAAALKIDLVEHRVSTAAEIEPAFKSLVTEHADGVLLGGTKLRNKSSSLIVDKALAHHVALAMHRRAWVARGALFCYNADLAATGGRIAVYIDKILKGAKPADLPVERPTKFELVINLKTAKALGITVPHSALSLADEVIE